MTCRSAAKLSCIHLFNSSANLCETLLFFVASSSFYLEFAFRNVQEKREDLDDKATLPSHASIGACELLFLKASCGIDKKLFLLHPFGSFLY